MKVKRTRKLEVILRRALVLRDAARDRSIIANALLPLAPAAEPTGPKGESK